jgi:enoyl-CoA hydratase/carnithine racemase
MSYKTISITHKGAADWLCLNRPERLNAINPQMCEELLDYFGRLQWDHAVRVVVIHGAGRAFCAGYDLKDAHGVSAAGGVIAGVSAQRQVSEVFLRMRRCPQPIICLAHGAASGGGLAFALASDVRIAARGVQMNVAMVRVGLTGCDVGISYFLPRAVGQSVAAELMMTGRTIGADRALATGLVSEIVEPADLLAAGQAMAEDMLRTSPLGLRLTKEGARMGADAPSLEAAMLLEDRGQILCAASGLMKEGIAAFQEKRAPEFWDREN